MCRAAKSTPQPQADRLKWSLTHLVAASLKALTAKPLTLFEAFIALTLTTLPNIDRLPAGVAAFCLILSIARPGIVNFPVFLHSATPISPRAEKILFTSFAFSPVFSATATLTAPAGIAETAFVFITFIAFIAFPMIIRGQDERS